MSIYDKARWHSEGRWPDDLPASQACVHIGFYLGWAIERGFAGQVLTDDFAPELQQFIERRLSAPKLLRITGGVLDDQLLSKEGIPFTEAFYSDAYLDLYGAAFPEAESLYAVPDTWQNYDAIKNALDKRFEAWTHKRL